MKYSLIGISLFYAFLPSAFGQTQLEKSVQKLAEQIKNNIVSNNKRIIAVVDFSYFDSASTEFDKFLTEEFITRLFLLKNDQFEIIERRLIKKIFKEKELKALGFLSPSGRERIGEILGVDSIITGTVVNLKESLKINARLIDVTSGKIFAVAAIEVPKTELVDYLTETLVYPSSSESTVSRKNRRQFEMQIDCVTFSLESCKREGKDVYFDLEIRSSEDVRIYLEFPFIMTQSDGSTPFGDPHVKRVTIDGRSKSYKSIRKGLNYFVLRFEKKSVKKVRILASIPVGDKYLLSMVFKSYIDGIRQTFYFRRIPIN